MRIIRFTSADGRERFGADYQDGGATVLSGSMDEGFRLTKERVGVHKLLAPIVPRDIICIGRNYRLDVLQARAGEKAAESEERRVRPGDGGRAFDMTEPAEPEALADSALEVFLKPSGALHYPGDPIPMPAFAGLDAQLDCEGELAVVMARRCRNVSESEALNAIFGYTIANDITARAFQTSSGPPLWMRGKGFDGFCPLGPAIVTVDDLRDVSDLRIRTQVNNRIVRDGSTAQMIHSVPHIIATLSRHMTLQAGCVILTGAPPLLLGSAPPVSLRRGDRVMVSITGLGELHNHIA